LLTLVSLCLVQLSVYKFFFFQAEDGIRDFHVTGVQTCALPISSSIADRNPLQSYGAYAHSVMPLSSCSAITTYTFLRRPLRESGTSRQTRSTTSSTRQIATSCSDGYAGGPCSTTTSAWVTRWSTPVYRTSGT